MAPETLDFARASLAAAQQQSDPAELALAEFLIAFVLMFGGHDAEAEPHYRRALAGIERVGDLGMQARVLSYYTILRRRLGLVVETRAMAERALEIAEQQGLNDYIGVAKANLCWVAFRQGDEVAAPAAEALAAWDRLPAGYTYPLQWLARIPLAAHLARVGHVDDALAQWQLLLDPAQCLLPAALNEEIPAAVARGVTNGARDVSWLRSSAFCNRVGAALESDPAITIAFAR
jgi:hypothetical protein